MKHSIGDLRQMQALPLKAKVLLTQKRIREWYEHWNGEVYIAFSGGKDSTVLLTIARRLYPDIEAVFVDTGLEYPEIKEFVKTFENVTILRPSMTFFEVLQKYGYPIISKAVSNCVEGAKRKPNGVKYNQMCGTYETNGLLSKFNYGRYKELLYVDFEISDKCCAVMKKAPMHEYQRRTARQPIIATMASESQLREMSWIRSGCNAFDGENPRSAPMSFWNEQDVLQYIKEEHIPIASVYGDIVYAEDSEQMRFEDYGIDCGGREKLRTTGCDRTGCIFCAFGCHLEKEPSRFQRLKVTHPKLYQYCIGGGAFDENGIWRPTKDGLGFGYVFDELNKIYGEGFIKY